MRAATRPAAVVIAVLTVAALTGCGGLAGSGPVRSGLEVGSGQAPELRIDYPGPSVGESREEIVRGFLRAGAASDGAYDSARSFLTQQANERWDPDATIVLLDDDEPPTVTEIDPATFELSARPAGTIDSSGRHVAAGRKARVTARFSLTTVSGQWRITGLPEDFGRWIAAGDVSRLVRPYAVHYVSRSARATIPDIRWFPLDRLATRLARAQLDPVPDHLAGAVTSAVPLGARLLGDAVPVENRVASVNLVSTPLAPGEATREDIWAQFVSTVLQDPAVDAVLLAVDGVVVSLDGIDGPVSALPDVGFTEAPTRTSDRDPVVRRGAQVTEFDPDSGSRERAPSPAAAAPDYPSVPERFTRLALAADSSELAAVAPGGDGVSRWRGGIRYEVPGTGSRVGGPSYDRRGYLWFGSQGAGADRLLALDIRADPAAANAAAARPQPVVAQWLVGRIVQESRVAADGDRVAILSTATGGRDPRIDLAGVIRGGDGRPQRLSEPLRLGTTFAQARGLTWLDESSVATVAATKGSSARPVILTVGGGVQVLSAIEGATAVASTGAARTLFVLTEKERLFVRTGARWADNGPATDLAAPAG